MDPEERVDGAWLETIFFRIHARCARNTSRALSYRGRRLLELFCLVPYAQSVRKTGFPNLLQFRIVSEELRPSWARLRLLNRTKR